MLNEKIKEQSKYQLNYNDIEDKIDFEKYIKKETMFSKITAFFKTNKLAIALTSLLLFIVLGSIILILNKDPKPNYGPVEPPKYDPIESPENPSYDIPSTISYNEASLIGIAAYHEFDKKEISKLSNVITTKLSTDELDSLGNTDKTEEYIKVSYPYDYVKIISAYKFNIYVNDIADTASKEIISRSCGLGNLEVVVADFETYVEEAGVKKPSVMDTLISLRGYNGYYTILVNSGLYEAGDKMHIFSSHKKLLEDEVNKDFTPPILSIFLEEKSTNERYVYFETSDNLLSYGSYHREQAFKNITEIEYVSKSTLYSVNELVQLPTKELIVSIINIDIEGRTIEIESETNLKYLYYNDATKGVDITTLQVGDTIKIEFDFLFEGFDPTGVYVKAITLVEVN